MEKSNESEGVDSVEGQTESTSTDQLEQDEEYSSGEESGEEYTSDEDGNEEEEGEEDDDEGSEEGSEDDEEEEEAAEEGATAQAESSDDENSERCPICLNRLRLQDVGMPESCDHLFCLECIEEWSKNVNTCPIDRQVYHIILAKHAGEDKVYKKISVENRQAQEEEAEVVEDDTVCEVCGLADREDRLLLCDGCDAGYHCDCLDPPLGRVPVHEWFCPQCVQQRAGVEEEPMEFGRQIARTRVSERVRRIIADARAEQAERRRVVAQRMADREMAMDAEPVAGSSTTTTRRTTRKRKAPARKRKTKRKRRTTTTKKRTPGKKKKRRKRKTTRKSPKVSTGSTASATPVRTAQSAATVKARIADRLGLKPPPKGRSIPVQKSSAPGGSGLGGSGGASRHHDPTPSFSILGNKDELYSFAEHEGEERVPVHRPAVPASTLSRSALSSHRPLGIGGRVVRVAHSRRPAAPPQLSSPTGGKTSAAQPTSTATTGAPAAKAPAQPPAAAGFDLLGSIMSNQNLLHKGSKYITIKKDGSLAEAPTGLEIHAAARNIKLTNSSPTETHNKPLTNSGDKDLTSSNNASILGSTSSGDTMRQHHSSSISSFSNLENHATSSGANSSNDTVGVRLKSENPATNKHGGSKPSHDVSTSVKTAATAVHVSQTAIDVKREYEDPAFVAPNIKKEYVDDDKKHVSSKIASNTSLYSGEGAMQKMPDYEDGSRDPNPDLDSVEDENSRSDIDQLDQDPAVPSGHRRHHKGSKHRHHRHGDVDSGGDKDRSRAVSSPDFNYTNRSNTLNSSASEPCTEPVNTLEDGVQPVTGTTSEHLATGLPLGFLGEDQEGCLNNAENNVDCGQSEIGSTSGHLAEGHEGCLNNAESNVDCGQSVEDPRTEPLIGNQEGSVNRFESTESMKYMSDPTAESRAGSLNNAESNVDHARPIAGLTTEQLLENQEGRANSMENNMPKDGVKHDGDGQTNSQDTEHSETYNQEIKYCETLDKDSNGNFGTNLVKVENESDHMKVEDGNISEQQANDIREETEQKLQHGKLENEVSTHDFKEEGLKEDTRKTCSEATEQGNGKDKNYLNTSVGKEKALQSVAKEEMNQKEKDTENKDLVKEESSEVDKEAHEKKHDEKRGSLKVESLGVEKEGNEKKNDDKDTAFVKKESSGVGEYEDEERNTCVNTDIQSNNGGPINKSIDNTYCEEKEMDEEEEPGYDCVAENGDNSMIGSVDVKQEYDEEREDESNYNAEGFWENDDDDREEGEASDTGDEGEIKEEYGEIEELEEEDYEDGEIVDEDESDLGREVKSQTVEQLGVKVKQEAPSGEMDGGHLSVKQEVSETKVETNCNAVVSSITAADLVPPKESRLARDSVNIERGVVGPDDDDYDYNIGGMVKEEDTLGSQDEKEEESSEDDIDTEDPTRECFMVGRFLESLRSSEFDRKREKSARKEAVRERNEMRARLREARKIAEENAKISILDFIGNASAKKFGVHAPVEEKPAVVKEVADYNSNRHGEKGDYFHDEERGVNYNGDNSIEENGIREGPNFRHWHPHDKYERPPGRGHHRGMSQGWTRGGRGWSNRLPRMDGDFHSPRHRSHHISRQHLGRRRGSSRSPDGLERPDEASFNPSRRHSSRDLRAMRHGSRTGSSLRRRMEKRRRRRNEDSSREYVESSEDDGIRKRRRSSGAKHSSSRKSKRRRRRSRSSEEEESEESGSSGSSNEEEEEEEDDEENEEGDEDENSGSGSEPEEVVDSDDEVLAVRTSPVEIMPPLPPPPLPPTSLSASPRSHPSSPPSPPHPQYSPVGHVGPSSPPEPPPLSSQTNQQQIGLQHPHHNHHLQEQHQQQYHHKYNQHQQQQQHSLNPHSHPQQQYPHQPTNAQHQPYPYHQGSAAPQGYHPQHQAHPQPHPANNPQQVNPQPYPQHGNPQQSYHQGNTQQPYQHPGIPQPQQQAYRGQVLPQHSQTAPVQGQQQQQYYPQYPSSYPQAPSSSSGHAPAPGQPTAPGYHPGYHQYYPNNPAPTNPQHYQYPAGYPQTNPARPGPTQPYPYPYPTHQQPGYSAGGSMPAQPTYPYHHHQGGAPVDGTAPHGPHGSSTTQSQQHSAQPHGYTQHKHVSSSTAAAHRLSGVSSGVHPAVNSSSRRGGNLGAPTSSRVPSYRISPAEPTFKGVATSDRIASNLLLDEVKKGFKTLVEDAVRSALRPAWSNKKVSKDEYKEIFKRAVDKVTSSKETVIQQDKIQLLVDAYVSKACKTRTG